MARYNRFTFLCDDRERQLIAILAERLERSQGDAIRYIVRVELQRRGLLPIQEIDKASQALSTQEGAH